MRHILLSSYAFVLLTSCGRPAPSDGVAVSSANATPASATVTPPPGRASTTDLSDHVGKYPFDPVGGVTFLAHPAVRAAVMRAVPDPAIQRLILDGNGPQTPIARKDGRILAWGCEAHNCGPHNWSLLVAPDGGGAEVCYHDANARPATRWFAEGRREARMDECPSGDDG
jgi:hypothetical protein